MAKKDEKKLPTNKEVEQTKTLKCLLTNEEQKQAAQALAANLDDLQRLENDLEAVKKNFKSQIAELEGSIGVNKGLVRDGWDYRKVNCVKFLNYKDGKVTVVRKDTGEFIEERDMYADERQQEIDFED